MIGWASRAQALLGRGPIAIVTILATEGSAPRGAGTRMIVSAEVIDGTIGGGQLEHVAIDQARAVLALPPGTWRIQDYPLGPLLGQCCGGRVRLLVEHLDPAGTGWLAEADAGSILVHRFTPARVLREPGEGSPSPALAARGDRPEPGTVHAERLAPPGQPLYMFGAGHVGRAIADKSVGLPLALAWFDTRPEAAERAGVALIDEADIEACAADAPAEAAVLILTHDHGLDYRLTAAALRGPALFIGLIGSATKRARFLSRLEREGFSADARARVTCPIGLPGIIGKEPEVIAIAALGQILALPQADA